MSKVFKHSSSLNSLWRVLRDLYETENIFDRFVRQQQVRPPEPETTSTVCRSNVLVQAFCINKTEPDYIAVASGRKILEFEMSRSAGIYISAVRMQVCSLRG